MEIATAVEVIKQKLEEGGGTARIPKFREGYFTATLAEGGVDVDNLGAQPFLPLRVFRETLELLVRNGGCAERGNAMDFRLGDKGLPLDSVEGCVAQSVFGKRVGDYVFRRITPICCLLVWAGLCKPAPNQLILKTGERLP